MPEVKSDSPETYAWQLVRTLPKVEQAAMFASTKAPGPGMEARTQVGTILVALAGVRWHPDPLSTSSSCFHTDSSTYSPMLGFLSTLEPGAMGVKAWGWGAHRELVDWGQLLPRWIRRAVYVYVEALLSPGLMTHVPDGETDPRGGEKWVLVGNWAA